MLKKEKLPTQDITPEEIAARKDEHDTIQRITNRWAYEHEDFTLANIQEHRLYVQWILEEVHKNQYSLDLHKLLHFSKEEFRIDMEGIPRYFDMDKKRLIAYEPLCSKGRLATKPTDPLKSNDRPHGVAVK
jgi:hypothetical protein|tara:strand:+ start:83 stop:475 length:393 start_codon:yes stop_codon:yes gene_type:complete